MSLVECSRKHHGYYPLRTLAKILLKLILSHCLHFPFPSPCQHPYLPLYESLSLALQTWTVNAYDNSKKCGVKLESDFLDCITVHIVHCLWVGAQVQTGEVQLLPWQYVAGGSLKTNTFWLDMVVQTILMHCWTPLSLSILSALRPTSFPRWCSHLLWITP